MSRVETKSNRLLAIEPLLLAHPEGLTQSELARRLGVHRSTIGRYISDLPYYIYIDADQGDRWKIDREGYDFNVRFTLHEALSIHLATRLLATRMDRKNPHAAASLRKLGLALEKLAPHVSLHMRNSADEMDDQSRLQDPLYLQNLEKLTLAWAEQRKVHVWHRHGNDYDLSVFFIEPYAIGQSTYVIGLREPPGKIRTFKIEGLENVVLTAERYEIPAGFNAQDLLADAWGIWYTGEDPLEISLKFSAQVKARVLQTRWHRSEQTEELVDGNLLWKAKIADPTEMIPWIRGWGADCEVIGPGSLRERIAQDALRTAEIYRGQ